MSAQTIAADYLIVGAGAAGMAFADVLLTETEARIAIVDRRHRPGGHWNDAYPFVRLHQPSGNYGVNSRKLGSDQRDATGLNQGLYELAGGAEVVSYFDQVMRRHFLPTGRVQYFPVSEYADGVVTGLLSGERREVAASKIVDAAYLQPQVPSTRPPAYDVAAGMICAPPNDLPRLACKGAQYVVIGAGKTGMDACLWLLEHGADPGAIRWIMPRDAWLLDRVNFQLGDDEFARAAASLANQVEAVATATSVADVFARLEASGELLRLETDVTPTAYHCATVTKAELAELRRIRQVIRMGRVNRIESNRIVLERGEIPTTPETLHIDCSASALAKLPPRPVFEGARITLQCVRTCQPAFSAAFIGHVEATQTDEAEKNRLCRPVPLPDRDVDWLRMLAVELRNRFLWSQDPAIGDWLASSRLDGFMARLRRRVATDAQAGQHLQRYAGQVVAASAKLRELLADAA